MLHFWQSWRIKRAACCWSIRTTKSAAQTAGSELAQAVQQTVLWPQDVRFPAAIVEHYPSVVPPLRTDRDTIVIGKLESHAPQQLSMTVEANGKTMELSWELVAERSSEDFAFLPTLVDRARDNGGLTLPTVGSAGLREAARVIFAGSQDLSMVGRLPAETEEIDETYHFVSFQEEAQKKDAQKEEVQSQPAAAVSKESDLMSQFDATSELARASGSRSRGACR